MSTSLSSLIKSLEGRDTPFVIYRKPGKASIHLISQKNSALNLLNSYSEAGFVMAPFSRAQQTIIIKPDEHIQLDIEPTVSELTGRNPDITKDPEEENNHKKIVLEAVAAIRSGLLRKVVLARKIEFDLTSGPTYVFENLLARHPNAFCYWWHHPQVGTWIGASPELFLSVGKGELITYSLAGTVKARANIEPAWTEKEETEQQLVTDYILEKLSQISIEAEATRPESVLAGKLWHLKSTISAKCNMDMLGEIINVLHPTPAVCGIPLLAATEYIKAHEGFDRKYYTGFLGEINMGKSRATELYVNLRCMEWQEPKSAVYVGGGITSDSDPVAEWHETEAKSRTVLNAVFNYEK